MIIIKLNGGLGNQMFQYALGKHLATLRNTPLKLDISWYRKGIRNYELKYFNIEENVASEQEIISIIKMTTRFKDRIQRNLIEPLLPYYKRCYLKEQTNYFDSNVFNANKNVYIKGYWQSEKYFIDIKEQIYKAFSYKYSLDAKNEETAREISKCNAVSIHIRRGDYVTNPEYVFKHGACDIDYYQRAYSFINKRITNPHYFIFSDDFNWTKNYINFFYPSTFISHNTDLNSYKDLLLMSFCKHNVIANSSFSWWAAWLNANRKKIIIAPKKWFNQESVSNKDIIPANWVQV